ncbi:hypothetical protein [Stenotrophomonas sp. S39]|uniref:hypothetical protein n=1 Tax=Stenotrophomonas sp. S39 TaxID=2767451 RepID=UPI0019097691|nr:hypothetical protein [Stenotrophomonas sp. S39]MBK0052957.1 hypothetical protein [Stenotrophomonas sp. S39]
MNKLFAYLIAVIVVALLMGVALFSVAAAFPGLGVSLDMFYPIFTSFLVCVPVLFMDFESPAPTKIV